MAPGALVTPMSPCAWWGRVWTKNSRIWILYNTVGYALDWAPAAATDLGSFVVCEFVLGWAGSSSVRSVFFLAPE
jgi:hypothetical protein